MVVILSQINQSKSFQYSTKLQTGVSSVSHTFNNIPTSLYPKAFDHMLNDEQKGIFHK